MLGLPVQLVSMPGPPPLWPSVQLGSLKAYVDQELGNEARLTTHSAHLSILANAFEARTNPTYDVLTEHGEYVYALLYLRRFVLGEKRAGLEDLLRRVNRGRRQKLSWAMLRRIDRATLAFIDDRLGPKLTSTRPNIVGFTLSHDQVYASLYCAKLLETRFPAKTFLFVYGGFRAGDPNTAAVMRAVGASGLVVRGEGERKLAGLLADAIALQKATRARDLTPELLADRLSRPAQGVLRIEEPFDFFASKETIASSQVRDLATLPIPDYSEFFSEARRHMRSKAELDTWRLRVPIPIEGSRGCFGRCDFCNFPLGWGGFRAHSKTQVFERAHTALRRYGSRRLSFVDDASDTWAEAYADEVIRQGLSFDAFLETRAHHREDYWIKLAVSGVTMLQIGAEALVTRLLSAMKKDTKAIQNLVAQKCLTEMGVRSGSNLITHHPRSTLSDVVETKRVLGYLGHIQPFSLSHFTLMAGSPLFDQMSNADRKDLVPDQPTRFPPALGSYETALSYASPATLGPSVEVRRAWNDFSVWYGRRPKTRLDVVRLGASDLVITRRSGRTLESHRLEGAEARVYDACHAGLRLEKIVAATGLEAASVAEILTRAIDKKLMLKVDDVYLSLALRPRQELVSRLLQKRPAETDSRLISISTNPRATKNGEHRGGKEDQVQVQQEGIRPP